MNALETMSPDLNRLLDESRWLGGLARRLVADPGLVDDLVQETLVSALFTMWQPVLPIPEFEAYHVSPDAVTQVTLELEPDQEIEIAARVRIDGGRPAGGRASLMPAGSVAEASLVDARSVIWRRDGSLRFSTPRPGSYTLRLNSGDGPRSATYTLNLDVGEEGLQQPVELDSATGTVALEFTTDSAGVTILMEGVENDAGRLLGYCWVKGEAGQRIEVAGVLAGRVRVVQVAGEGAAGGPPEEVASGYLSAGRRLDLHVP